MRVLRDVFGSRPRSAERPGHRTAGGWQELPALESLGSQRRHASFFAENCARIEFILAGLLSGWPREVGVSVLEAQPVVIVRDLSLDKIA